MKMERPITTVFTTHPSNGLLYFFRDFSIRSSIDPTPFKAPRPIAHKRLKMEASSAFLPGILTFFGSRNRFLKRIKDGFPLKLKQETSRAFYQALPCFYGTSDDSCLSQRIKMRVGNNHFDWLFVTAPREELIPRQKRVFPETRGRIRAALFANFRAV
jgi:hypothetical protein